MKNTRQMVTSALRNSVLTASKGKFICTKCLKEKENVQKATQGNVCRTCRSGEARENYRKRKEPRTCIKCGNTSTRFTGEHNTCNHCKYLAKKEENKNFRNGLGDKLLVLWKAGYAFDEALKEIRFGLKNFKGKRA